MKKTTLFIAILVAAGLTSGQAQGTWVQKADFGGSARDSAVGFSIGGKGYIGTGAAVDGYQKDFWEYDPSANTWTQKADFGGKARDGAVGFSIASKGYIGTGGNQSKNILYTDFWEYDVDTNIWTRKAAFGGKARVAAVGFSIDGKGYIGTGTSSFGDDVPTEKDFWEYDPATNIWVQKADFGGDSRGAAAGFAINGKGYIGIGVNAVEFLKDFWEYDPAVNTWTQKADFNDTREATVGFSIGDKGYIGTGDSNAVDCSNDFWEYDPLVNTWTRQADFAGGGRCYATGFSINNKGYLGVGFHYNPFFMEFGDFWEYSPSEVSACEIPTSLSTSNVTDTSATLRWAAVSGAVEYQVNYKVIGATKWIVVRSTSNSKTLGSLTPGTSYVWRVRTVCSKSPLVASAYSGQVQFTTTEATTTTCDFATNLHSGESASPSDACDIPSNVTEVEILPTRAILRWDAVSGALGYEIAYREVYPDQGATVYVCTTRMRVTLENLNRNASYRYSIRAICSEDPLIVSDYTPESEFRTTRQPR